MGRLGSEVWVSTSFQIFALTAGKNVLMGEGNCPGRGSVWGDMFEGKMCYSGHIGPGG